MKRSIIFYPFLILLFIVSCHVSNAQEAKSLLWKVEKEGFKTSYLYGTIHLIPAERFAISKPLQKAINTVDELIIEADLSNQAEVLGAMQYARLPKGGSLDTMLSPADAQLLDSVLQAESGMSLKDVQGFKPFFLESLLISNLIENEPVVVDMEIAALIKKRGAPLNTLETIKEQMQMFDSIPYRRQMDELMDYLKEGVDMKTEYEKMLNIYLAQDVMGLYNYMYDYYENDAMLYFLLEKRNAAWVPKLEEGMQTKSLLVAVGAGHLGGPTGLIALLQNAGYTVTAVN